MKISSEIITILFSCKKNINPTLKNIDITLQRELKQKKKQRKKLNPKKEKNPNKKF